MNYKKKAKAILLKTIREADGEKAFQIHGDNLNSLGRYLEELVREGRITEVRCEKPPFPERGSLITYRLGGAAQ